MNMMLFLKHIQGFVLGAILVIGKQTEVTALSSPTSSFQNDQSQNQTVTELNQETFIKTINQPDTNFWLIAFYDPSCPYSQSLLHIINDVAPLVHSSYGMSIGTVDCSSTEDLCGEHSIQAYPSLKWYRDGLFHLYENGMDDHDDLMLFAKQMNENVFKYVDSYKSLFAQENDLGDVDESNGATFLLYSNDDRLIDSTNLSLLRNVARNYQDKNTFMILEPNDQNYEWMKQYVALGSSSGKKYTILMKIEQDSAIKPIIFRDSWTQGLLTNFIERNKEVVVPLVHQMNIHKYGLLGKNLVIVIVDIHESDAGKSISKGFLTLFRQIAFSCPLSVQKEYKFVYMNSRDRLRRNDDFLKKFNISIDDNAPQFFVLDFPHDIYWKYDKDSTEEEGDVISKSRMERFLLDIIKGEILSQNPNINEKISPEKILYDRIVWLKEKEWALNLHLFFSLLGLLLLIPQSAGGVHDLVEKCLWGMIVDPLLSYLGVMENSAKNLNQGEEGTKCKTKQE